MTVSLDGRSFRGEQVTRLREDREGVVTGTYAGGEVVAGTLVGRRDGRDLEYGFGHLTSAGAVRTGVCVARIEVLPDGLVRLHEQWRWTSMAGAGTAVLDELPGDRWVRTRVAHPTRSLAAAVAFYGDLLGLAVDGPHDATPYQLAFFTLPGGAQLELTAGGPLPLPATDDDLLVLYLASPADVATVRARLEAAGVALVPSLNPYWDRMGCSVRDPDGRLVVLAHPPA